MEKLLALLVYHFLWGYKSSKQWLESCKSNLEPSPGCLVKVKPNELSQTTIRNIFLKELSALPPEDLGIVLASLVFLFYASGQTYISYVNQLPFQVRVMSDTHVIAVVEEFILPGMSIWEIAESTAELARFSFYIGVHEKLAHSPELKFIDWYSLDDSKQSLYIKSTAMNFFYEQFLSTVFKPITKGNVGYLQERNWNVNQLWKAEIFMQLFYNCLAVKALVNQVDPKYLDNLFMSMWNSIVKPCLQILVQNHSLPVEDVRITKCLQYLITAVDSASDITLVR